MEVEGCCLLCLEVKQELVEAIFIYSDQCNELNIQNLLQKFFWTMPHIKPNSWLCDNCWREINNFHNFYTRVKKIHQDYEMFAKEKDNCVFEKEDNIRTGFNEIHMSCVSETSVSNHFSLLSEKDHREENEGQIIEFKEAPNDILLDCPISASNNDYTNPLLDVEVLKEQADNFTEEQITKPRRTRKTKYKDSISKTETRANNKGKKNSTNKSNGTENKLLSEQEIKSEEEELVADNSTLRQEVAMELEKDFSNLENDVESISETDTVSIKSFELKKNQAKDMRNVKDKFLAENFKLSCFLCESPFDTFNNVLKHFKTHHNERGFVQCCDKKFYRRNVLIDHVNYHINPNYFKCHQCSKAFVDRRRLELHCASHEANNGKKFCCNICGKGFIKLGMLTAHKKTHISEEEKRFPCSECGKKFASNYMRANHCRTTHLKKYHKICEICGKSIQDKTIFERHMLQHEGKNVPSASCDICGLLLTDEKALERHKKVIHPENGQKVYTCHICSKVSPNMRSHKLHVRFTHESGYNYKCSLCDKAYKRPRSLKEHMASHTGETLYSCPWCPKTFNSNANMHNHRKKVHPKEWEETSRKRYSGKLPPRFKPPLNVKT